MADNDSAHALLNVLRSTAETGEMESGITILVGGSWISGTLTSLRVYLDTVAAGYVAKPQSTPASTATSANIAVALENIAGETLNWTNDDRTGQPVLHLRDATVYRGAGRETVAPAISVRIDRVDAVIIGTP